MLLTDRPLFRPDALLGRTVLVTGAFSGLGLHFSELLARHGASVAMAGRRLALGEQIARELGSEGLEVMAVEIDVTHSASVAAAIEKVEKWRGGVDVLVNNAGIATTEAALSVADDDWDRVVDTNLGGNWRMAQAAARSMSRRREGGAIVNVASILGLRTAQQVPAYAASKAALLHLTRVLALEWARHNIRVNALAPGYVETEINRDFLRSEAGQRLLARVPTRRAAVPCDLDGPMLLLASSAAAHMTGSIVVVDGGHAVSSL